MVTSQCNEYLAFYFCNTFKIDHRKKRCKKDPHLQKPLSCDPKVKLTDFQRPRPNRKAVRRPCSGKSGSERKKQFPKNAFLGAARGACVFHCLPLYSLLRLPIEHEKTLINWGMQPIKPSKYFLWNFSNFAMIV